MGGELNGRDGLGNRTIGEPIWNMAKGGGARAKWACGGRGLVKGREQKFLHQKRGHPSCKRRGSWALEGAKKKRGSSSGGRGENTGEERVGGGGNFWGGRTV